MHEPNEVKNNMTSEHNVIFNEAEYIIQQHRC